MHQFLAVILLLYTITILLLHLERKKYIRE
jgi:hypothetical protein